MKLYKVNYNLLTITSKQLCNSLQRGIRNVNDVSRGRPIEFCTQGSTEGMGERDGEGKGEGGEEGAGRGDVPQNQEDLLRL